PEITLAGELQRETAVCRKLRQHVIEKADAGFNRGLFGVIQVHAHVDLRLLGLAQNLSPSRKQRPCHLRPGVFGRSVAADRATTEAQIRGKLEVRVSVSDDRASGSIDRPLKHIPRDEPRSGLAARTPLTRHVRTDEYGVELDALRPKDIEHKLLSLIE